MNFVCLGLKSNLLHTQIIKIIILLLRTYLFNKLVSRILYFIGGQKTTRNTIFRY